jgi:hypothetical protein
MTLREFYLERRRAEAPVFLKVLTQISFLKTQQQPSAKLQRQY